MPGHGTTITHAKTTFSAGVLLTLSSAAHTYGGLDNVTIAIALLVAGSTTFVGGVSTRIRQPAAPRRR